MFGYVLIVWVLKLESFAEESTLGDQKKTSPKPFSFNLGFKVSDVYTLVVR